MHSFKIASKTYADFAAAGNTITLSNPYFIPKKGMSMMCVVNITTAFTLPGSTFIQLGVGNTANNFEYISVLLDTAGVQMNSTVNLDSFTVDTSIKITMIADQGLSLNNLSAGVIDIYVVTQNLEPYVVTISGNTIVPVPKYTRLASLTFIATNAETVRIGTTNGGQEVLPDTALISGYSKDNDILLNYFVISDTLLYINGITHSCDLIPAFSS